MKQFASTHCEHHQENYTLQSHYIKLLLRVKHTSDTAILQQEAMVPRL